MNLRRTHSRQTASAKAGFSPNTVGSIPIPDCPRTSRPRVAGAVPILWPHYGSRRSSRCCRPNRACGRSPSWANCSADTRLSRRGLAAPSSGVFACGRLPSRVDARGVAPAAAQTIPGQSLRSSASTMPAIAEKPPRKLRDAVARAWLAPWPARIGRTSASFLPCAARRETARGVKSAKPRRRFAADRLVGDLDEALLRSTTSTPELTPLDSKRAAIPFTRQRAAASAAGPPAAPDYGSSQGGCCRFFTRAVASFRPA